MTSVDDALLLLAIVRRHLRTLQIGLDPTYPAEDWGFTAQQAVEKLLKARIVLDNRQAPRVHDLADLALMAGENVEPDLLRLQVFAVEARYEEGPFPLPAGRSDLLSSIELLLQRLERAIAKSGRRDLQV